MRVSEIFGDLRPRERIISQGVSELSDSELISVILGNGIRGKNVIELSNELSCYLKTRQVLPEFNDLKQISGLGQAKSCQILACLELSSRFLLGGTGVTITTPAQLVPQLSFLKHRNQEHMVCICLNGANRVAGIHVLTIGLANQTQIHPREAFSHALQDNAVSVIFAHNHPSGTLKPSPEDIRITERLVESGRVLDIPVLDHLIISREGWSSLKSSHPLCFR